MKRKAKQPTTKDGPQEGLEPDQLDSSEMDAVTAGNGPIAGGASLGMDLVGRPASGQ